MPFSKAISFRRLLNAPIDEPNLVGGHSIWEERDGKLKREDTRDLYLSWKSDCCEACEEIRLYEKYKNNESFVGKGTPPKCLKH